MVRAGTWELLARDSEVKLAPRLTSLVVARSFFFTRIIWHANTPRPTPGHFLVHALEENGMDVSRRRAPEATGAPGTGAHFDLGTDKGQGGLGKPSNANGAVVEPVCGLGGGEWRWGESMEA